MRSQARWEISLFVLDVSHVASLKARLHGAALMMGE